MPLDTSGSKNSIGKNIHTEVAAGKPRKPSIAIAVDVAKRSGKKPVKKAPPKPISKAAGY